VFSNAENVFSNANDTVISLDEEGISEKNLLWFGYTMYFEVSGKYPSCWRG
jgi:hypothetical protein